MRPPETKEKTSSRHPPSQEKESSNDDNVEGKKSEPISKQETSNNNEVGRDTAGQRRDDTSKSKEPSPSVAENAGKKHDLEDKLDSRHTKKSASGEAKPVNDSKDMKSEGLNTSEQDEIAKKDETPKHEHKSADASHGVHSNEASQDIEKKDVSGNEELEEPPLRKIEEDENYDDD